MILFLDPAHGKDTPGKRSPDGKFREYLWSREICSIIMDLIYQNQPKNFKVILTNESEYEIGLPARVKVANNYPIKPSLKFFLSIHANAAGKGDKWMNARGFSVWTHIGQTRSDEYATIIYNNFKKDFPDIPTRKDYSDGDPDFEQNFYVLAKTICPAVLIETLFQDNKKDVEILLDPEFKHKFALSLFRSIIQINNSY